jgi:hypothetical protein
MGMPRSTALVPAPGCTLAILDLYNLLNSAYLRSPSSLQSSLASKDTRLDPLHLYIASNLSEDAYNEQVTTQVVC